MSLRCTSCGAPLSITRAEGDTGVMFFIAHAPPVCGGFEDSFKWITGRIAREHVPARRRRKQKAP